MIQSRITMRNMEKEMKQQGKIRNQFINCPEWTYYNVMPAMPISIFLVIRANNHLFRFVPSSLVRFVSSSLAVVCPSSNSFHTTTLTHTHRDHTQLACRINNEWHKVEKDKRRKTLMMEYIVIDKDVPLS